MPMAIKQSDLLSLFSAKPNKTCVRCAGDGILKFRGSNVDKISGSSTAESGTTYVPPAAERTCMKKV